MLSSCKDNAVTIDGYVIGFHAEYIEENRKSNSSKINVIIYGEYLEEIKLRINELEG
ncbi:unknown [Butyrivibrio sp. CAG:318]|nr:unknown [Butyrivibrio sp. CAG:318]